MVFKLMALGVLIVVWALYLCYYVDKVFTKKGKIVLGVPLLGAAFFGGFLFSYGLLHKFGEVLLLW